MSTSHPNKKGIHQSMMKCIAVETGFSTVKALISDHLWNSEKWSQLELVTHEKELLFKGPRDFLPLSTTTHGALVNILKNWTFSYRDNTFPTILDRLRSVFHESKILGLAEYLGNAESLKVGENELLRDGFGNNPLFHCVVAEEVRQDNDEDDVEHKKSDFPVTVEDGGSRPPKRSRMTDAEHPGILGVGIYYFTYSTWEGPVLYIEDLFVIPSARGQGIGSSLMAVMAKIAKSRDCCRMQWVSPFSKRTMGFYRQLGATSMTDWTLFRMERTGIEELCSKQFKKGDGGNHE